MALKPWLWWVKKIVTVVVNATQDHGSESPALHAWFPLATARTYMNSLPNLREFIRSIPLLTLGGRIDAWSTKVLIFRG
jgi:hypothetical protein